MAGWRWPFALDFISFGFGDLSIKSSDTQKIFFTRSSTETGKLWPILLTTIIKISGATIGRGFSNACGKVFAGYAEPESSHPIQLCRLKGRVRYGSARSHYTAPMMM